MARLGAEMSTLHLRLGYRGLTLLMFGLMFTLIGLGTWIGHSPSIHGLVHTFLPYQVRALIWIVPGVLAVSSAWFAGKQWIGFAALFVPAAEMAFSYWVSMFCDYQVQRIAGVGLYTILTVAILLFASWPEPPQPLKTEGTGEWSTNGLH